MGLCRNQRAKVARGKPKPKSKPNQETQERKGSLHNPYGAEAIVLKKRYLSRRTLGELRINYGGRQAIEKVVTPQKKRRYEEGKFERMCYNSLNEHMAIYGADHAIVAYRISSGRANRNHALEEASRRLPETSNSSYRGVDRGTYRSRHYCVWAPYSEVPFVSAEFIADGAAAAKFMSDLEPVWKEMSIYFKAIFPKDYREYTREDLPNGLRRMAGAYAGVAVNLNDREKPVKTEPHRDVKEPRCESVTTDEHDRGRGNGIRAEETRVSSCTRFTGRQKGLESKQS
jgi:hypothetical protein